MVISSIEIKKFQEYILSWWELNRRDLPWRHTHDPYKIIVSEMMLQQTQVLRVIPKYAEFIEAFPDVKRLAEASTADVLKAWKGMGYNRRDLFLKKMAVAIVEQHGGVFPQDEKRLLALPGIGKYTSRALMVFAFKQDVSMIDTNIRQIIVHHFFNDESQKESLIESVADQLVPKGKSWEWHQALMDYGSLIVRPHNSKRTKTLKDQSNLVYKTSIPFKETNRFIRGRIIDLLREDSIDEDILIDKLVTTYDRDREQVIKNIEKLISEGLIEKEKNKITLPI